MFRVFTALFYNTVFSRNNIVVHYYNGLNPDGTTDLDDPQEDTDDIDFSANMIDIDQSFIDLEQNLTAQDQLFILLHGHGFPMPAGTALCLPNAEFFYEDDIDYYTRNINCAQIILIVNACLSGCFIDDFMNNGSLCSNKVIHTSTDEDNSSYYEGWMTGVGDPLNYLSQASEFLMYWNAAAREYYPGFSYVPQTVSWEIIPYQYEDVYEVGFPFPFEDYAPFCGGEQSGYPQNHTEFQGINYEDYHPDQESDESNPDNHNNDGFVQMSEIFQYANDFDTYSEYGYFNPWWVQPQMLRTVEYPQESYSNEFINKFCTLFGIAGSISPEDLGSTPEIEGNYLFGGEFTIEDGVTFTILAGSQITLSDEVEFIVKNGAELIIESGVSFYCGEGSKIKVEEGGSFIAFGPNILFTSSGEDSWEGIELLEAEESYLQDCRIENADTGVLLYQANTGTFQDNVIINCNTGLLVKGNVSVPWVIEMNDFNNNTTGIFLYYIDGQLPNNHFYINHNTIVGDEGDGIYVNNCGIELEIGDNTINNNKYGIRFEYSDRCELLGFDSDDYLIEDNTVGVSFYRSTVDMEGLTITNNSDYGLMFLSDSHPSILSNRIINNGDYELYCNYGHPVMADGHNDIVNSYHGYLGYRYRDNFRSINCRYNWWGSNPPDPEKFEPYGEEYFRYDPADESSNHPLPGAGIGEDDDARIAYKSALETEGNGNYSLAAVMYEEIINIYPSSEEAILSLRRLFKCVIKSNGNINVLKVFYEDLANSNPADTVFCLLSRNLTIDCDKENELYEDVFLQYSNILELPIDEADSIFTQIDVLNTLLEIEEFDRNTVCFENLPENIRRLNPKNIQDFQVKSQNLMDNLFGESDEGYLNESLSDYVTLKGNYPNPFNPITTISFSIPNDSKINLSVFNLKGQKVRSLVKESFKSGDHSVVWNGKDETGKSVSSGIYFYKLTVNGVSNQIRKCILMK